MTENKQVVQKNESGCDEVFWDKPTQSCHKILCMCPSTSSTVVEIFTVIDTALIKSNITWDKCISLAVSLCRNTSINAGQNNYVKTK